MFTRTGGAWTHEYSCLSTDIPDELPTLAKGDDIPNGSTVLVMDQSKVMIYDRDGDRWIQL